MSVCKLYGNDNYEIIHRVTSDRKDIDVLKCEKMWTGIFIQCTTYDVFYSGDMNRGGDF